MGIGGQGDLRFMQLLKVGLMVFAVAMQVVLLAACNPCPNTCDCACPQWGSGGCDPTTHPRRELFPYEEDCCDCETVCRDYCRDSDCNAVHWDIIGECEE